MSLDVKLLYVKKFNDRLYPDKISGHPKIGGIYRVIKRKANERIGNVYQVFFDLDDGNDQLGIFIPGLKASNDLFDYELEEVTIDEILDLDLDDSVYTKLKAWGPDFSNGLTDNVVNVPIMNRPIEASDALDLNVFATKLAEAITNTADKLNNGNASLGYIATEDKEFYTTVNFVLDYLASTYSDKYESGELPNISKSVLLSSLHGKGANGYNVLKYMQRYLSDGFEKSGNHVDLLKAIHFIMFELTRLIIHGEIKA